ncbi:diaminopimelate epimerase [Caldimonas tepidiphila]|uniref:diaminopimelate epimerase n=1 Tax=Caldimonas tepidiphila TaxID=2315841 RepID=UPI000E5C3933|nr:diaminopimelate epimerase [Caldimonas tepidiphila]
MLLRFTKMQGAGNDFVVLDATREPLALSPDQFRRLADRRFGVGADQILIVGPSPAAGIDFIYRIVNADGSEVEQCGNGARCFAKFVHDKGLTDKTAIRVQTMSGVIEPALQPDGRVTVDMGAPVFEPARIPFDPAALAPRLENGFELWPLDVDGRTVEAAAVSMGNPHAVMNVAQFGVADVDDAPVAALGPLVERHARFPRRVNAGFLQVVDRARVRLRVYERGSGETLACGTGACAAVVAGIRAGWLDRVVDVETRGGRLTIAWDGIGQPVRMTGPAVTVFEGEIEI